MKETGRGKEKKKKNFFNMPTALLGRACLSHPDSQPQAACWENPLEVGHSSLRASAFWPGVEKDFFSSGQHRS